MIDPDEFENEKEKFDEVSSLKRSLEIMEELVRIREMELSEMRKMMIEIQTNEIPSLENTISNMQEKNETLEHDNERLMDNNNELREKLKNYKKNLVDLRYKYQTIIQKYENMKALKKKIHRERGVLRRRLSFSVSDNGEVGEAGDFDEVEFDDGYNSPVVERFSPNAYGICGGGGTTPVTPTKSVLRQVKSLISNENRRYSIVEESRHKIYILKKQHCELRELSGTLHRTMMDAIQKMENSLQLMMLKRKNSQILDDDEEGEETEMTKGIKMKCFSSPENVKRKVSFSKLITNEMDRKKKKSSINLYFSRSLSVQDKRSRNYYSNYPLMDKKKKKNERRSHLKLFGELMEEFGIISTTSSSSSTSTFSLDNNNNVVGKRKNLEEEEEEEEESKKKRKRKYIRPYKCGFLNLKYGYLCPIWKKKYVVISNLNFSVSIYNDEKKKKLERRFSLEGCRCISLFDEKKKKKKKKKKKNINEEKKKKEETFLIQGPFDYVICRNNCSSILSPFSSSSNHFIDFHHRQQSWRDYTNYILRVRAAMENLTHPLFGEQNYFFGNEV